MVCQLNRYQRRSEALQAIKATDYTRGTTNTASAIRNLRESMFTDGNGERRDVFNIAVILTDGASNDKVATLTQVCSAYPNKCAIGHPLKTIMSLCSTLIFSKELV